MSNLTERLCDVKAKRHKGLIAYLTAGYPDFDTTLKAVLALETAGADVIELGIPFSDPIADGPVIQKAAALALKGGATTAKTLDLIKKIRQKSNVPIVIMTYINTILQYGTERFICSFAKAGMDAIIVPDLPLEESELIKDICRRGGVELIQFIAPTTTEDRVIRSCQSAEGFLYCISSTGVTGVRNVDYTQIASVINVARKITDIPMAIGFGIGSPKAACEAAKYADAVIVGSAIVERLTHGGIDGVQELISSIRRELDKGVADIDNIS